MTVATPPLRLRSVSLPSQIETFFSLLWRDVFVTGREFLPFFAQVIVQPLFSLLIFGKVLSDLGYTDNVFGQILLPGLVALNAFLAGLQSTALPLVLDFSYTREIEDRLLAPVSMGLVAVEKIVFGAIRGLVAGLFIVPLGFWLLHMSWPAHTYLPVIGVLILGALVASALGMVLGTLVSSRRIEIMLTVALTPLIFTGSTQFPFLGIKGLLWFQIVCGLNPCTYMSEAMRAIIAPRAVESLPLWVSISVLGAALVVFTWVGIIGFMRRALD
ncbi:ABC transporter permease [Dactylosporangium sp. NPDC000244]|uniref:ABC transporter permease n=1 Tax=Dactylosporangium sp. NPDC000244 TaxID=3154365 RepID=UPI003323E17F